MVQVVVGLLVGWVAALPIVRSRASEAALAKGFAGLIFSFIVISLAVFASRAAFGEAFLAAAMASILSFLGFVLAALVPGALGRD